MKTVLLTGGNRGLGRATAQRLAQQGHRVIVTVRRPEVGAEVEAALGVEVRLLDLASLDAVRAFAQRLVEEGTPLDVLFHNAGVMQQSPTRRLTVDGFEETLGVNVLAPFLLTHLLEPVLRRAPAPRVVCVSSRLHLPGSRGQPVDFDFDDPQLERGYHPERAYKNSKLALLWFTYELARRTTGWLTANAVCPGFVPTTAAESTHGFQRLLLRHVLPHFSFATSVKSAAQSLAFMALDPSLDSVTGRFYGERKALPSSADSMDEAHAQRFWELASACTRAPLVFPPVSG